MRSSKQCSVKLDMRLDTSLTSRLSGFANDCVEINIIAPTGLSLVVTASSTVPVEHQRLRLLGEKDYTFLRVKSKLCLVKFPNPPSWQLGNLTVL